MATKAELLAAIAAIDPEAVTEGLTNAELAELLDELSEAEPEAPAPEAEPEAPAEAPAPGGDRVADGVTLTSLKGVLPAGTPVKPEYFSGGKNTLAHLKKAGKIV